MDVAFSFRRTPYTDLNAFTDLLRITGDAALVMGSGASCTAAGVWTNASDLARKNEIKDLNYGLAELMQLQAKSYRYNTDDSQSIGFIAQEMEKIIPEVVSGEEGNKGVAYGLLTSVLTNAVQEQQAMIEQLKTNMSAVLAENAALKAQNQTFESRFAELESKINQISAIDN